MRSGTLLAEKFKGTETRGQPIAVTQVNMVMKGKPLSL